MRGDLMNNDLNKDCLVKIKNHYSSFRAAERKVADFILESPVNVVNMSVIEMSNNIGVSEATIVKFSQKIGFKGFQQLKIALAIGINEVEQSVYGDIEATDNLLTIKEKIFKNNQEALKDTNTLLDIEVLEKATSVIEKAERLYFFGIGASNLVALDAQQKFLRIGLNALAFTDSHFQVSNSALIRQNDVVVGISHSGRTNEVIACLHLAKSNGATCIAITNDPGSPLARIADINLHTVTKERKFRLGAISSIVAQLTIIDAIFIPISLRRADLAMNCLKKTNNAISLIQNGEFKT
jgi:RpiR family carbohydrate utilization transcriptional regulator